MAEKPLHHGHRARLKERYLASEFREFSNHEILEMILFFGIPRRDTNETAHKLINHFGSFSKVLDASLDELMECGLPENAAIWLKLVCKLSNIYVSDRNFNLEKSYSVTDMENKILELLMNEIEEKIVLVMYDAKGMELFCGIISEGDYNWSEELYARIAELSVRYHATTIMIAHNKLNGVAAPTPKDIDNTMILFNSLSKIGVRLNDHYIVAGNELYSMVADDDLRVIFA